MNDEILKLPIVKKNEVEISKILVGTSPFIAAGQFEKSYLYYLEFVMKRGEVAKILSWCLNNGFTWIQAIDVSFLASEIGIAYEHASQPPIIVLSTWDKPNRAIERFKKFDVKIVLAHASVVDHLDVPLIKKFLAQVRELGFTPGIATHTPNKTLHKLKHVDEIRVVMVPLNYAGLFNEDVDETLEILKEMNVAVIAKKVLGAGRLPVERSLLWALSRPEIDSIALGVASLSEAEYTLLLARQLACRASVN